MKLYHAPYLFFRDLVRGPLWINIWVQILMMVNFAGVFFWHEPLAQLIFFTFVITSFFMMYLYSKFGMARILGLGHVLWLLLIPYLMMVWPTLSGDIKHYITIVIICNTISLIFDINDVRLHFVEN
mgnify:FL=1